MSFQGTLDLFSLADILRLLAAGGKEGLLGLRREGVRGSSGETQPAPPQRVADTAAVALPAGQPAVAPDGSEPASGGIWLGGGGVAWAATRPGPEPFARRLQGLGAVDPEALSAALHEAGEGGSLTATLLRAGAVPADRLQQVAMEHVADELFDLARWSNGSFSFAQGERPPEALDPVAAVEDLLAETERRLAAWPEIAGRVPGRSALLAIPPRPADADPVTVDPAEWRLLAAVGGRRSVASLLAETGQGEFQTCQALAAMVERGLLAVAGEAEPEAAPPATPPEVAAAEAAAAPGGPGGDAAGPAPAPGPGPEAEAEVQPEVEDQPEAEARPEAEAAEPASAGHAEDAAQAMLERLISGVRGL
ncbi:MAG TPA: DUF4388 domain-containing protein [Actinomycetes bacterium]